MSRALRAGVVAAGAPAPDYLYEHAGGVVITTTLAGELIAQAGIDSRFNASGFNIRIWPAYAWNDAAASEAMRALQYSVGTDYFAKQAAWNIWRVETDNVISAINIVSAYGAGDEMAWGFDWVAQSATLEVEGVEDPNSPFALNASATNWTTWLSPRRRSRCRNRSACSWPRTEQQRRQSSESHRHRAEMTSPGACCGASPKVAGSFEAERSSSRSRTMTTR